MIALCIDYICRAPAWQRPLLIMLLAAVLGAVGFAIVAAVVFVVCGEYSITARVIAGVVGAYIFMYKLME